MRLPPFSDRRRWPLIALGLGVLALAAVVLFAPPSSSPRTAPERSAVSLPGTLPQKSGASNYVGSVSCRDCHQKQHQSWARSFHRSMTQVARTNTVVADFNNVQLLGEGERFTLRRAGNEFWVDVAPLSES